MKKIMVLLLATTMLFASVACSNGNGAGNLGNGNGGSESVVTKDDYLGTWTGTWGSDPVSIVSITLNTDGSCVAYCGGFAEGSNWTFTNPGVTVTIPRVDSFSGRLDNGKLVGQGISLTKVDTSAYVGTWTSDSISITLNANGTVSGNISGSWTVINSNVKINESGSGRLTNGRLEGEYDGQAISLTKQ